MRTTWFAEAAVSGALISEGVQVVMMIDTRWSFAEGMIIANPAYFPCEARRQSQSCGLLARVTFRWHVPVYVVVCGLASLLEHYGEVGVAHSEPTGDDDEACDFSADVFLLCRSVFHLGGQVGQ